MRFDQPREAARQVPTTRIACRRLNTAYEAMNGAVSASRARPADTPSARAAPLAGSGRSDSPLPAAQRVLAGCPGVTGCRLAAGILGRRSRPVCPLLPGSIISIGLSDFRLCAVGRIVYNLRFVGCELESNGCGRRVRTIYVPCVWLLGVTPMAARMAVYPSGLRGRIANPLFAGSNPAAAFPSSPGLALPHARHFPCCSAAPGLGALFCRSG